MSDNNSNPNDGNNGGEEETQTVCVFGKCFCGKYMVRADGEVHFRAYCHCSVCRRMSGAPVTSFLGMKKGIQVAPSSFFDENGRSAPISEEEEEATLKDLLAFDSSPFMTRHRCEVCGCPLVNISKFGEDAPQPDFRDFSLGILEPDDNGLPIGWEHVRPTVHIFYASRCVEDFAGDSLPKFSTFPGSEML